MLLRAKVILSLSFLLLPPNFASATDEGNGGEGGEGQYTLRKKINLKQGQACIASNGVDYDVLIAMRPEYQRVGRWGCKMTCLQDEQCEAMQFDPPLWCKMWYNPIASVCICISCFSCCRHNCFPMYNNSFNIYSASD